MLKDNNLLVNEDVTVIKNLERKDVELLEEVVIVDRDADLDMFCYGKCEDKNSELVKRCRGVVFHKDELIMEAFPYTQEYTSFSSDIFDSLDNWLFYESHEGCLLRFFNFNKKWYLCTHRRLNAFKSRWSGKESFGNIFKRALYNEEKENIEFKEGLREGDSEDIICRFQETLNPENQYMFLVLNTEENRIVCDNPINPKLYYTGSFCNVSGGRIFKWDEKINIERPKKLDFKSEEEISEYIEKVSYKKSQGIICFNNFEFKKPLKVIKIYNDKYMELYNIRNNESSINFRYLQLRNDREKVLKLRNLYPKSCGNFDNYESILLKISQYIYNFYVERYINKRYVTIPPQEYYVMRKCHEWHLLNRKLNRISFEKIFDILNTQPATSLNKMIRNYKLSKKQWDIRPKPPPN